MNNESVLGGATWIASWFGPMVAFWIAAVIIFVAIAVSWRAWVKAGRLEKALDKVNTALKPVNDATSDSDAHRALRSAYQDIAGAVSQSGHDGLQRGWTECSPSAPMAQI